MKRSTSSGSPSSPRVDGMKPKSYGKTMPSGRTWPSSNAPSFGSKLYLLWDPLGVSMTTRQALSLVVGGNSRRLCWDIDRPVARIGPIAEPPISQYLRTKGLDLRATLAQERLANCI